MCWAGLQETRALAVYYNWKVLELEGIQDEKKIIYIYIYREFSPNANFITANFVTAVFQNFLDIFC